MARRTPVLAVADPVDPPFDLVSSLKSPPLDRPLACRGDQDNTRLPAQLAECNVAISSN